MAVAVRTLDNFIAGEWRPASGDRSREIASPVTGEVRVSYSHRSTLFNKNVLSLYLHEQILPSQFKCFHANNTGI